MELTVEKYFLNPRATATAHEVALPYAITNRLQLENTF